MPPIAKKPRNMEKSPVFVANRHLDSTIQRGRRSNGTSRPDPPVVCNQVPSRKRHSVNVSQAIPISVTRQSVWRFSERRWPGIIMPREADVSRDFRGLPSRTCLLPLAWLACRDGAALGIVASSRAVLTKDHPIRPWTFARIQAARIQGPAIDQSDAPRAGLVARFHSRN